MDWINQLTIIPAIAVALTSAGLIMFEKLPWRIAILAAQYGFVTWLSASFLPLPIASVKLITGILVALLLFLSWRSYGSEEPGEALGWVPGGQWFRILGVILIVTSSVGLARENWIGLPGLTGESVLGATLLFSLALLQLGLSEETEKVGIGLVSLLSGFEIIYAAIEPSLAVLASLALVHIGIAMLVVLLMRWDSLVAREGHSE